MAAPLLVSCATVPLPQAEPPVRGETPGYACRNAGLEAFAGRTATAEIGAEMLRLSGAKVLRWVPHGAVITMEYRSDRLTVRLEAGNRIESVSCG